MGEIEGLNLKSFVANAIDDIFETMLSMKVELSVADAKISPDGKRIVGSVGFAGKAMGSLCVHIPRTFAQIITGAMLGKGQGEIDSDDVIHDAIAEFCNMVGGDLKSRLNDAGLPCQLSIPSITSGSDFEIDTMDWSRRERFVFRCQDYLFSVEVFIKSGS